MFRFHQLLAGKMRRVEKSSSRTTLSAADGATGLSARSGSGAVGVREEPHAAQNTSVSEANATRTWRMSVLLRAAEVRWLRAAPDPLMHEDCHRAAAGAEPQATVPAPGACFVASRRHRRPCRMHRAPP